MNAESVRRADFPSHLDGLVAELSTPEHGLRGYMLTMTSGTGPGPDDLVTGSLLDFVLGQAGALSSRSDFIAPPRDFSTGSRAVGSPSTVSSTCSGGSARVRAHRSSSATTSIPGPPSSCPPRRYSRRLCPGESNARGEKGHTPVRSGKRNDQGVDKEHQTDDRQDQRQTAKKSIRLRRARQRLTRSPAETAMPVPSVSTQRDSATYMPPPSTSLPRRRH